MSTRRRRHPKPAAERGRAVAVPADRGLRVPVQLPHRRARRAGRRDRLALRPALRRAERLRQPARPRGRVLPVRAVRDHASDRARLRARHERARDDVEDAVRLDRRPRRADDGAVGPRGQRSRRTRGRRPTTTPTTCSSATVECLEGRVEVELVCEPVFDYGRDAGRVDARRRRTATPPTRAGRARRSASSPTSRSASRATACAARHVLETGRACVLRALVGRGARGARRTPTRPRRGSPRRSASGAPGSSGARIPDHRWRDPIQRSALTIKGLTYMPTGATVAALTTSLPETPGGERNWDYRYTWMRDTTFTLQALHWLNLDWEADEFMQFVADLEPTEDGSLQIMYGIDGRRDLTESTRDDLSGYAGARPVRIGNGAFDQRQNDVFGAVLDSILLHTRQSERLPRRLWPIVQSQAECATRVWREPGPGHLGGARRAAALRLVEAHVLGRARPRREARGDPRRPGAARARGARPPTRSAPTSSSTASASGASCASTTRPTRSTPRRCSRRSSASCPATTSGCARPCWRSPTS